jgi:hypothetical protein
MTYVADRLSAADALAEDGQSMTLAYVGGGTYNPATGTTSGSAPASATVKGVILPLGSVVRHAFTKESGSLIVEGDQELLLAALDTSGNAITAPQVNGTITDANAKPWTIVAVDPLSPAGTDILYDCIVRRAA